MQAKQLLASSGVTMAAGAMISLSFAVSSRFTLLSPQPVPVDANGNVAPHQHRTSKATGAVIAETFERRWQAATEDNPPMVPLRDPLEGLIGGLPQDPLQETQVEPPRDPLEGLIGGLRMLPPAQDAAQ